MYKYLVSIGFRQSKTDQCLFVKQEKKGPVILLMYIDNSIIIEKNIDEVITEIKTVFTIKIKTFHFETLSHSIKILKL